MKLKRDEFFKLNKSFESLASTQYNKYFLHAVSFNKKQLISVIEEVSSKAKDVYTKEYYEFDKELKNSKSQEEFDFKIEKYKPFIDEFVEKEKDFKDFLNEEIEIELKKIKFEHIPESLEKSVYENLEIIFEEP